MLEKWGNNFGAPTVQGYLCLGGDRIIQILYLIGQYGGKDTIVNITVCPFFEHCYRWEDCGPNHDCILGHPTVILLSANNS